MSSSDLPKLLTTSSKITRFLLSKSLFSFKNQPFFQWRILDQEINFFKWKEYFPNLLETALLCQIFVFWVRDFKFWLRAYFFDFSKLGKVWAKLNKLDIRHFIRVPLLMFSFLSNLSETLYSLRKLKISK